MVRRRSRSRHSTLRRRIGKRDPDDVDVLALALDMDLAVWSNDNDFEDAGVEWHTTDHRQSDFQACSFNHSDISPFRINDLRATDRGYRIRRGLPSRSFDLVCIEWFDAARERPFGGIV